MKKDYDALVDFVTRKVGEMDSIEVVKDDGKTIWLEVTCEEDGIDRGSVVVNRRKGSNGSFRIICQSI